MCIMCEYVMHLCAVCGGGVVCVCVLYVGMFCICVLYVVCVCGISVCVCMCVYLSCFLSHHPW